MGKKLVGRPTLYKKEYCDQAYRLCLIGATDKELASFFCVSESTVNKWKVDHKEFSESIKGGKEIADMEIVHELYKGAKDKVVTEQQAFKVKSVSWDAKGRRCEKESIEVVDIEKTIPADFRNQQFWLKNRQKEHWRDKVEVDSKITTEKQIIVIGGKEIEF